MKIFVGSGDEKKTRNACVATDSQKFRTTRIFFEGDDSQQVGEDLRV